MSLFSRVVFILASCLLFGAAIATDSQSDAQETSHNAVSVEDAFRQKPTNLQVLPQETSAASLRRVMKGFEQDLGVRCRHCHAEDAQTQTFDYASDENPRKQTARAMISMLNDINDKYLAQLGGDRRYAVPVTCGSCHQGQGTPPAFGRNGDE